MKKSAKLLSAVMAGAMVLSMAGCGSSSNSTETTAAAAETTAAAADSSAAESKEATSNTDATVIKLGTTVNEQDSFQVCAEKFAELVKRAHKRRLRDRDPSERSSRRRAYHA